MFDFFRKKGNNPEEPAKDGGSQNAAGATASGRTTRDALAEFTATPLPDAIDGLLFRVSMADPTDPTSSSGFDAYAARLLSEAEAPSLRAIAVEHPVELRRLNTTGLFWSIFDDSTISAGNRGTILRIESVLDRLALISKALEGDEGTAFVSATTEGACSELDWQVLRSIANDANDYLTAAERDNKLDTQYGTTGTRGGNWDLSTRLAAACEAAGGTTLLATGDRDSLQLVDDNTTVLLATNKETISMDPAAIREKYGVEPQQLIDVKSLMGDASDNIPGVPGIGEKTALALISKFGSLQGVYDNIDDKAVKPGQRAKLTANRDKADLSYMLGTIRKDAPIETDPAAYLRQPGDPAAAAQLLAALEMHKLVDRWGLNGGTAPAPSENAAPLETVEPSPLPLLLEGRFYAARNADGDWYLVQGQDVYLPDTDRLAGFVGRLNHQKNPLFLMEVFAAMAAQDPHWKLLLVGTGEMEPEMRAAAARRGLTDRVIFAGVQSDVPAFMNAFDLFLLPSNFEGSPVTLVEAQGCGVPCLASTNVPDDGSVTDLVHFLPLAAPLTDWAAKAEAIAAHGDHDDHWAALSAAGYELKTAARRMEQLYDKLGGHA